MSIDDRLWGHLQVADYIGTTPGSFRVMCSKRQIPFLKIGRRVRFRKCDIDEWLEGKLVEVSR